MQTVVGLLCVALGCMHFVDRARPQQARSYYLGTLTGGHRLRGTLAFVEVVFGFVLLFLG